jgi:hypothetical protein
MPNYIKLGNLRIEIPEPANNGGGGGGGGGSSSLLTGLLAFYNLSDLTDSSGNGNTLTNNNGVTFSSGKIGNAATLNGSNWLTVTPTGIEGRNLSVFCWVKTSGAGYNFVISADKSGEQWGNLMTQPGGTFWGEFFLDGNFFNFSSNTVINNNEWRHIGMTSSQNEIKLIVQRWNYLNR